MHELHNLESQQKKLNARDFIKFIWQESLIWIPLANKIYENKLKSRQNFNFNISTLSWFPTHVSRADAEEKKLRTWFVFGLKDRVVLGFATRWHKWQLFGTFQTFCLKHCPLLGRIVTTRLCLTFIGSLFRFFCVCCFKETKIVSVVTTNFWIFHTVHIGRTRCYWKPGMTLDWD